MSFDRFTTIKSYACFTRDFFSYRHIGVKHNFNPMSLVHVPCRWQEVKPDAESVLNTPQQSIGKTLQICSPANERSPSGNFIADNIIIGRQGLYAKDENQPKGMKM